MVKQSVRKKVSAAKQAATEKKPAAGGTVSGEDGALGPAELDADAAHDEALKSLPSHQKRKVTKRAKFLEKIRVATATKMKASKKKKGLSAAFTDFATLESTLGDIAGRALSPGKGNKVKVLRAKARTKLVESETGRMQAVLSHPQFQANPIAAISNHIAATLKKDAASKPVAPRGVGAKDGKGVQGGKRGKAGAKVVDVKVESDEVALANQLRGSVASMRGIGFAGGAKKGALGVKHTSNVKKGKGGKKGSKRSKKRAQEVW